MSLHPNSYILAMEKESSHTQPAIEHEEISVLLRSLRIEATPEAHFEERFVYDFRERLIREAACRPARALLWEHLLQLINNLGGRRLAWSLSSFSVGAICMGVVFTQYGGGISKHPIANHVYELSGSTSSFLPNAAKELICTSVSRAKRNAYSNHLIASRLSDSDYLADADEDSEMPSQYFTSEADDNGLGVSVPGFSPRWAH